jgi:hypothetical protein
MTLNPSQIGDITELKCQVYLIEQGWNVLTPIGNHQKYDLVIEKNGKFYKIQVKHARPVEETGFLVRTKYEIRENGKVKKTTYSAEDVDYFMTEFNNKVYISARAIDEVNVQIIMERIGGGGHLNIAGAQLEGVDTEGARVRLKEVLTTMTKEGAL